MSIADFFSDWRMPTVCLICMLVNILTTTTGAARASGVITKRIATSMSVFNLFMLISRLANLAYVPVMATIVDLAASTGDLQTLLLKMRIIVVFATLGCIIGFLLLPTFIEIYIKSIHQIEKEGSLPMVIIKLFKPSNFIKALKCIRRPSFIGVDSFSLEGVPSTFLIFNVLVFAIWTIGVLAATYASAMVPELARTATLLSGMVNGFATITLTLIVDPVSALITDQAVHKIRPIKQVNIMVLYLTLGNILGTVLSQFLLLPGAKFIEWGTKLLGS
ncbi:MAG: lipid II flippase Amj family protein [Chloroflexi bacterium]|nr:lipid II flippase Amj family protein [Chloroflexota bacterium]